jgi:hypothetical protein
MTLELGALRDALLAAGAPAPSAKAAAVEVAQHLYPASPFPNRQAAVLLFLSGIAIGMALPAFAKFVFG